MPKLQLDLPLMVMVYWMLSLLALSIIHMPDIAMTLIELLRAGYLTQMRWLGLASSLAAIVNTFWSLESFVTPNSDPVAASGWWMFTVIGAIASYAAYMLQDDPHEHFWPILAFHGTLLFASVLGFGQWRFARLVSRLQRSVHAAAGDVVPGRIITSSDIQHLPAVVQRWLSRSGCVGRPPIRTAIFHQSGAMRLKPEATAWIPSASTQTTSVAQPAFVWSVSMMMGPVPVLGRDLFQHGQGSMLITAAGLVPFVNVGPHPKINQSALQRYLGEICWLPSAALAPYITWQSVDSEPNSARATMRVPDGDGGGSGAPIVGSAVFRFTPEGDLLQFVAPRYKEITDAVPLEWRADATDWAEFEGFRIPTKLDATWMLPAGPFTWFKFDMIDAHYEF